jgi:Resolvase, N terminal domain
MPNSIGISSKSWWHTNGEDIYCVPEPATSLASSAIRAHVHRASTVFPGKPIGSVRQYAASHNMEIVQAYSDHGRSGLNIAGREGLNRLMTDVENKQADFSALLVYDVSRWAATYPFWMSSMRTASCPVLGGGAQL